MTSKKENKSFTPTHHALLFVWISREVVRKFGEEKAEPVIREAVKQYAYQRGGRMALRAQADGRELNMLNYLVYGEWTAPDGEMEMQNIAAVPHLKMHVKKCPWNTAWKENDLIEYGRYYCLEIDEALVHGYNSELSLGVSQTMTNGAEYCDFSFNDANLTSENAQIIAQRKTELGTKALMSWEYHTAHLYKTISRVIVDKLGSDGEEAVCKALKIFENKYGNEALAELEARFSVNFNQLP